MQARVYSLLLIVFLSLAPAVWTFSQEKAIPIEVINNKEYYKYTVKPGEGLFNISKNFEVTQAEISNVNPHIQNGLRAGQTLLIPVMKKNDSESQLAEGYIFIRHKVETRQTLFAISRKYNTPQELIIKANPSLATTGLKAGETILIPVNETEIEQIKEPKTDTSKAEKIQKNEELTLHIGDVGNFFIHTVQPQETLYSLSKQYGAHVDDIIALNPEAASVLHVGDKLNIPIKAARKEELVVEKKPEIRKPIKSIYKVAYFLPFMSEGHSIDPTSKRFIEFYLGSLLAINNAKNNSVQYEIFTFDIEKTEAKVHEVINKPEMQTMDLIIGPAYTGQVAIIADFAKRHRINTIIPFSSKVSQIEQNPYLFQFNPDQDIQLDFLINTLKNRFRFYSVFMVETGSKDKTQFNQIMDRLRKHNIDFKLIKSEDFEQSLSFATNNLLFFDNEDYAAVKNTLTHLNSLSSTYSITAFGQYSWRAQSGARPNMIYVSPFTGAEDATKYYEQQFLKYYKKESKTFNPRFDILGYDLSNFFLSTMTENGFTFDINTQNLNYNKGVQSSFSFIRTNNNKGGFINTRMYLIEENAISH